MEGGDGRFPLPGCSPLFRGGSKNEKVKSPKPLLPLFPSFYLSLTLLRLINVFPQILTVVPKGVSRDRRKALSFHPMGLSLAFYFVLPQIANADDSISQMQFRSRVSKCWPRQRLCCKEGARVMVEREEVSGLAGLVTPFLTPCAGEVSFRGGGWI